MALKSEVLLLGMVFGGWLFFREVAISAGIGVSFWDIGGVVETGGVVTYLERAEESNINLFI